MEYPYFKGLEADRYSFYRVPKALVKADPFQKMSGDAKLLYAVLLDRMSLSIKNGWQDKHGNAYIICTIEEVMDSIHCARQKAVKLLDELEQEFRLIKRRRQGLGKPNLLYVKDLYAGLSQSNYWKYENHTYGSLKNELPGVPKSNGSNTEKINKTDNSETDLIYPAELYLQMYESGIIDSSFGGGLDCADGCAMLLCSGDSEEPERVREAVLSRAEALLREGIGADYFLRMKRSALGRRIKGLDSFDGTCFRLCAYHFAGFDYFRFPAIYQDITPEEVLAFLARVVKPDRCALSVIDSVAEPAI